MLGIRMLVVCRFLEGGMGRGGSGASRFALAPYGVESFQRDRPIAERRRRMTLRLSALRNDALSYNE